MLRSAHSAIKEGRREGEGRKSNGRVKGYRVTGWRVGGRVGVGRRNQLILRG